MPMKRSGSLGCAVMQSVTDADRPSSSAAMCAAAYVSIWRARAISEAVGIVERVCVEGSMCVEKQIVERTEQRKGS